MTEKNIIKPNPISFTTHHIHLFFDEKVLANGSAFIYQSDSQHFLITNWHNVTGRHPQTGECLSETSAVPNRISTLFRTKDDPASCYRETFDLYEDVEGLHDPVWLEHPEYGQNVDVVAIPIPEGIVGKYKLFPINDINFNTDIREEVADDAFVIGYPYKDVPYLQLPIWKRASIATEPTVNIDQLPKFLIDTATRSGLSGSLVIMQRTGIHNVGKDGVPKSDSIIGTVRNFVGIYSGRIDNEELKAQLGIVWKARVVDEILSQS